MKGFAAIVVLSLVALCSSLWIAHPELRLPKCPPQQEGDLPTFFPDPYNCSCYYECSWGIPVPNFCPGDLLWNVYEDTCDYPENVDCEPLPATTVPTVPTTTATTTTKSAK